MRTISTARRLVTVIALTAACIAGASTAGVGITQAEAPTTTAGPVNTAHPHWQFEFTAEWTVTLSCYFENLDRTDATGPEKYTGTGKTKDAAEKDAWNKAQAAAPKGRKVKHCRVESSSKK
ncbi:hypothetical protein IU479_12230 [Nocardia abscessus]|uniref:hypothetical protein n=1 Tax=Nocardia TaxID=1817 RepID=UPI0018941D5F|nr:MULTISPECIES: hypothetical protein [Nocardia]MBF6218874.1 hypothetical protein [Nocardia abscessus]MDE1668800.1 hypothetical protein [Nocardia gipuzkoensis]